MPTKGHKMPDDARRKLSRAIREKWQDEAYRKKVLESFRRRHWSEEQRRKFLEANSGKNHWNYGKHHSEETRRKISESNKGKIISEEARRKASETLKGRPISWSSKISKALKKYRQSHPPAYPKLYYVKELGHSVRSKWEEEMGLLLKSNNISYRYESKTFKFNGTSYTPDFIVGDNVIEVKGPLYDLQRKKYKEFNRRYPELNFIMVGSGSEELCDIHIPWKERERLIEVLS